MLTSARIVELNTTAQALQDRLEGMGATIHAGHAQLYSALTVGGMGWDGMWWVGGKLPCCIMF